MSAMASQITSVAIVYSTVCSAQIKESVKVNLLTRALIFLDKGCKKQYGFMVVGMDAYLDELIQFAF